MEFRWDKFICIWKILDSIFSNWKKIRISLKFWNFGSKSLWGAAIFLREKRFSDFAQNWLICTSENIKFIKMCNIPDSSFSNWKNIRISLKFWNFASKSLWGAAIFLRKKRFSDFAQNWLICSSDDINLLKFGTFRIPVFPIGKMSILSSKSGFSWS